jgi:hypothetical protein
MWSQYGNSLLTGGKIGRNPLSALIRAIRINFEPAGTAHRSGLRAGMKTILALRQSRGAAPPENGNVRAGRRTRHRAHGEPPPDVPANRPAHHAQTPYANHICSAFCSAPQLILYPRNVAPSAPLEHFLQVD